MRAPDLRARLRDAGKCGCEEHADATRDICATCRFGFCPGCSFPNEIQCRRRAPVPMMADMIYRNEGRHPGVAREHWCGEYERDPARAPRPAPPYVPLTCRRPVGHAGDCAPDEQMGDKWGQGSPPVCGELLPSTLRALDGREGDA
jgi:hypothetical protein